MSAEFKPLLCLFGFLPQDLLSFHRVLRGCFDGNYLPEVRKIKVTEGNKVRNCVALITSSPNRACAQLFVVVEIMFAAQTI